MSAFALVPDGDGVSFVEFDRRSGTAGWNDPLVDQLLHEHRRDPEHVGGLVERDGVRRRHAAISGWLEFMLMRGQQLDCVAALAEASLSAMTGRGDDHSEVGVRPACSALGVSRATLDRLCADEVLPHRRLPGNSHRRLRTADIADFIDERERMRQGQAEIVDALAVVGLAGS